MYRRKKEDTLLLGPVCLVAEGVREDPLRYIKFEKTESTKEGRKTEKHRRISSLKKEE